MKIILSLVIAIILAFGAGWIAEQIVRRLYRLYGYPIKNNDSEEMTKAANRRLITRIMGKLEFVLFFMAFIILVHTQILGPDHTSRDVVDRLFLLITGWLAIKTLGYEAGKADPLHEVDETTRHYIYLIGTSTIVLAALLSAWAVAAIIY